LLQSSLSVIPVPTLGGYRNLLAQCGDSDTTGTSFGRTTGISFGHIPLRYSRNDEPCLNSLAGKLIYSWINSSYWRYLGYFLLYAFLMLLLYLFVAIAVVTFGLFTCCMGFLLLIIPYVNSVVLLPISYTFRAFGPEFLGQFGEDFKIFSE